MIDLNETTPWVDLVHIFKRPRLFFSYFAGTERLPSWVTWKGVIGFSFVVWLATYVAGAREMHESLESIQPAAEELVRSLHKSLPWLFGEDFNVDQIRSRMGVLFVTIAQVTMMFKPFIELLFLFLTAATAYVFLPMMGVPKNERSMSRLFMAGVYANWFAVLGIIPVVGSPLGTICAVVFYTLAVKWMYRISFWRSLMALYILNWLMVFATALVGLVLIAVLIGLAMPH